MDKKENSVDILDIAIMLAKHKWFIIITLLLVSIAVVTYSLLATMKWTSTTTFKPIVGSTNDLSNISSLMSGNLSSLLSTTSGKSELVDIIRSREFLEDVINEFDLVKYFEIEEEDKFVIRELALKSFRENVLSVGQDLETGIITISITTREKMLSPKIANFIVRKLEDYIQNVRMTKGKEERQFLEKRVEQIDREIKNYTNEIKKFQENYNIIELDKQLPSVMKSYSDLVSKYLNNKLMINYSENFLKNTERLKTLKFKQTQLKEQIKDIETGNNNLISYQIALDSIPDITQKYTLLKTKLEILQNTYKTIYPQLEMAKLQELRDTQTINIIDPAIPAGLRSWPKRAQLCIIVFFISLFALVCYVIVIELWKQKINQDEKIKRKYEEFRSYFWGKK